MFKILSSICNDFPDVYFRDLVACMPKRTGLLKNNTGPIKCGEVLDQEVNYLHPNCYKILTGCCASCHPKYSVGMLHLRKLHYNFVLRSRLI